MWVWAALLIAVLSAACFLTRALWRLWHPLFGNDTWYHLMAARAIRNNRFRVPQSIGMHFNRGDWDYPPLLSYILAAMKPNTALKFGGYLPAVFDTASCAVLGVFLAWLPGSELMLYWPAMLPGGAGPSGAPSILGVALPAGILLPLLGMTIWILTPMTCIDAFQHLSPRPLANLWMLLAMLLSLLHFLTGDWRLLIAMLVPVTLIYLTHKFTLQALTMLNIGLLVYARDPLYLAIQGAGFLLAVALSGGYYLKVLRGHLAFMNFYRTRGAVKYPGKYGLHRQRLMKIVRLDTTGNPWLFFLIPLLWLGNWPPSILVVMALTMAVAYLLVSLNPLLFLGEPERYFESAAFPLAVVIPIFLLAAGAWAWIAFLAVMLVGAARIFREMRGREEQMSDSARVIEHYIDPDWKEACDFMRGRPGKRILTVSEYFQWGTAFFAGKPTQGTEAAAEYGNYNEEFPATPENLQALVQKYQIDIIFVARAASNGFDFSFARQVFANGRYVVYETGKPVSR